MDTITTERLLLRPVNLGDTHEMRNMLYDGDTAWWADLPLYMNTYEIMEGIRWAMMSGEVEQYSILDQEYKRFRGMVQVMLPVFTGENPGVLELGYVLDENARGNGYMTEAVCAVRNKLFEDPSIKELVLKILPDNARSLGVAKRCGFVYVDQAPEEKARRHEDELLVDRYVLTREQFYEKYS